MNFFKQLIDHIADGVYYVDRNRTITYWNKGAEAITGYTADEVVGRKCSDNLLMHVSEQGQALCTDLCPLLDTINGGIIGEVNVYLHHKNGHRVPVRVKSAPIQDDEGKVIGAVEVFAENTARVAALERVRELEQVAFLDPLTNLANRRYGESFLESRFNEFHRYNMRFGILSLDIDHFKNVNDAYGHDFGDKVLQMVANTMASNIRSYDLACRWGGEEFNIILSDVNADLMKYIAEKLRVLISQSCIEHETEMINVTISIGGTLVQEGDTPESLLKRADDLMYQSKTNGRNQVTIG
ncbi:MAG: diguanylate cyclase [Candidatus Saccharibacteria bacterium]